jgi:leucyl-tRNA synthetase
MSKSLGNVLNPDDFISKYGADTLRAYYMFLGPFEATKPWDSKGIVGVYRFLNRIWRIAVDEDNTTNLSRLSDAAPSRALERLLHQTVKKVGEDIDALRFNTAVSALMILLNAMEEEKDGLSRAVFESLVKLISPFAPHIAEELWQRLGNAETIFNAPWPEFDEAKAIEDTVTLVLQVNGKLRDKLDVPRGLTREALEQFARESTKVKQHMGGKQIQKVIVVPDKLVNVVIV